MRTVKNILIAPDKFKFTLTANEVIDAVYQGLPSSENNFNIVNCPLADGGEGTSDILADYFNADKICINVNNSLFKKIDAYYYFSRKNKTAIIDLSSASGLQLLDIKEQNPMFTSSFGTGEMILDAYEKGAKKIIVGLGGSSVNDMGIGAANAIGYRFLSNNGFELRPIGKNLIKIFQIDDSGAKIPFYEIEIISLYDVKNQLYGKNGAAYTFAGQKGASKAEIKILDRGLSHLSDLIKKQFKKDCAIEQGSGAAGGFGAGSYAFFNAKLKPGSKSIFDYLKLEEKIKNCDLLITGEGKFDKQSLRGKVTGELIKTANKYKKPVAVICGISELESSDSEYENIKFFPLFKKDVDIETAKQKSVELIIKKVANIIEVYNLV
ncbi:MAG: glycerate kinase [Bacteroidales bacterium]|nr:glycerate kinase [Bacteroidales bacterium]